MFSCMCALNMDLKLYLLLTYLLFYYSTGCCYQKIITIVKIYSAYQI